MPPSEDVVRGTKSPTSTIESSGPQQVTPSRACIDGGRTRDLLPNQCTPAALVHVTDDHNI
jgi:hypothetical protein